MHTMVTKLLLVAAVALAVAALMGPVEAQTMTVETIPPEVDEILWRTGISPHRTAGSLDQDEKRALGRTIRSTVTSLDRRGGSHTGDLMPARGVGGCCPVDGEPLQRDVVGGRTTWWCPGHQR